MIFIDTSAFVAINDFQDPHYNKAIRIIKHLITQGASLITSSYILTECYTVISQKAGKAQAIFFKENFDPRIRIIRIDESLEEVAWEIFKEIKSKNVSYVDCTSLAIMKTFNIKQAFAFDDDFKRLGFSLLT